MFPRQPRHARPDYQTIAFGIGFSCSTAFRLTSNEPKNAPPERFASVLPYTCVLRLTRAINSPDTTISAAPNSIAGRGISAKNSAPNPIAQISSEY